MDNTIYLLLRRIRVPLIMLVIAYAIAILGFVLIPGQDDQGRPWRMDFFHAFYFVSYMATTIGFGEIPYPFTDAQRLWATFTTYLTVISWVYGIGAALAVFQDPAFRRLSERNAFIRHVRRISEPFYIICGYGKTGGLLSRALALNGIRSVVIDIDPEKVDLLRTTGGREEIPALCADAANPENLVLAGLTHSWCRGVVSVTNSDYANLTVAMSCKLMVPRLPVICRADTQETVENMASFGTDHIINPFETFAELLILAIRSSNLFLLYEILTSSHEMPHRRLVVPPSGQWLLCGYGRLGKAIYRRFQEHGIPVQVIEAQPALTSAPPGTITESGTDARTLLEGGVRQAAGIIGGTDDDTNNLSIIVTARQLNPNLFVIARQQRQQNQGIFAAADPDLLVQPAAIIARRALTFILNPLLARFVRLALDQDEQWASNLVEQLIAWVGNPPLDTWVIDISSRGPRPLLRHLLAGKTLVLADFYRDIHDAEEPLHCIALMLVRNNQATLLPPANLALEVGDQLLFGGSRTAEIRMLKALRHANLLEFLLTGQQPPRSLLFRWLHQRRTKPNTAS